MIFKWQTYDFSYIAISRCLPIPKMAINEAEIIVINPYKIVN